MVVPVHIIASATGRRRCCCCCLYVCCCCLVVDGDDVVITDVGVDDEIAVAVLADVSVVNAPSFVHVVSLYVKVYTSEFEMKISVFVS